MMNRLKKLMPVILVVLLSLSLVDCSCSEPAAESETESGTAAITDSAAESKAEGEEPKAGDISGVYEITSMITDGEEMPAEDLELLKSKGLNCTITLDPHGTGVLDLFGEETALTWDEAGISTPENKYSYTCEAGQLVITNDNSSLTFVKK